MGKKSKDKKKAKKAKDKNKKDVFEKKVGFSADLSETGVLTTQGIFSISNQNTQASVSGQAQFGNGSPTYSAGVQFNHNY